MQAWKRRWFSVLGTTLYYYMSHTAQRSIGQIFLHDMSFIGYVHRLNTMLLSISVMRENSIHEISFKLFYVEIEIIRVVVSINYELKTPVIK